MNQPQDDPLGYEVVIVHYLQPELLMNVVQDIEKQTTAPERKWIADNGRGLTPIHVRHLESLGWTVLALDNLGYAAAVNAVRREQSTARFLLVLTHDVQLETNTTEELVRFAELKRLGATGPILSLQSAPDTIFSFGGSFAMGSRVTHNTRYKPIVDWIDGAVMLLSYEALAAVNWFDEAYFLYYEEVDLCHRLAIAGWSTGVASQAHARQEPGNFTPYLRARNQILYARRVPVGRGTTLVLAYQFLRIVLQGTRRRDLTPAWLFAKGVWDGLREVTGPPNVASRSTES